MHNRTNTTTIKKMLPLLALIPALVAASPLASLTARRAPDPVPASTPRPASASNLALARADVAALSQARPDARDLYDLTRRLKLHRIAPIDPYVRATAPTYPVGHIDMFYVAQATSGYFLMKATLLLKTAHANWYVQQDSSIPPDRLLPLLRSSANDFETHVYPTDHAAFGQELPVGPDHDPRITILNANLPGVGGYYSAEDLYPRGVNAYSNQRKMLYVNIDSYELGTPGYASTVAHEFQHMIHWYQHERDDAWINEGSSMLAQTLNGYSADGLDAAFAAAPGTQVSDFCYGPPDCPDDQASAHYGAGFQWMLYFYQHYGADRAMRAVLADKSLSTIALFDDVLARLGSHDTARDMFRKWTVANFVDDPGIDGGVYGYKNTYPGCCIHASVTTSADSYPYTYNGHVNQFATNYVELKPNGARSLTVRFAGDPTVGLVPNAPVQGNSEWWSNRGDELDSTLTRAFDLSRARRATLRYDLWYNVEKDFDYGYVEVSGDGGRTWRTLKGRYTTDKDPNGSNYGNGYTGFSAKAPGNRGGWLHEDIDLSRYAGRHILVRFEHITDDAYNLSGLTLDNIRVPELGFTDGPGLGGWQTRGWVRVHNILPTEWQAQAIIYSGHGIEVRQVPLSAQARGQTTITGLGGDVQRVVLAISPTAPQTTVPSNYNLSVRGQ